METVNKITEVIKEAIALQNPELEAKFEACLDAGASAQRAAQAVDALGGDQTVVDGIVQIAKTFAQVDQNLTEEQRGSFTGAVKAVITNPDADTDAALDALFDALLAGVNAGNDLSDFVNTLLSEPEEEA